MIVKAIYKDKDFDYFNDKVTGEQRKYGDIFECDDELANERIKRKFVKKATKEEEKEYYANQTTVDDDKKDKEQKVIKPLEECTKEELIDIAFKEDICIDEQMTEEQLIETINKIRVERLEQSNDD